MKLTTKHKAYAAIVGLGLCGFAFDRLVLAEPAADNVEVAQDYAVTASPRVAPAVTAAAEPAAASLAGRMRETAQTCDLDLDRVSDAFKPTSEWTGRSQATLASAELTSEDAARAEAFQRTHKLNSVMKFGKGGIAVVNGTMLKPGQTLDGFKLVSVNEKSAVLSAGGRSIELHLPDGPVQN